MKPDSATPDPGASTGRIEIVIAVVLVLVIVAGWFLFVDRDRAPESPEQPPSAPVPVDPAPIGEPRPAPQEQEEPRPREPALPDPLPQAEDRPATEIVEAAPEPVDLEQVDAEIRQDLEIVLAPDELERVAPDGLVERLVTTLNSLDGDAVPLRFRPLEQVPGLPKLDEDALVLPDEPDPRYAPYRAMFERLDNTLLVEWFDQHEDALEQAWQAMGEAPEQGFRQRAVEVLEHLADFELPEQRPELVRPEVLYEYADPALEAESWGRKILIRIGPEHASVVQRRLADLARRLDESDEGGQ